MLFNERGIAHLTTHDGLSLHCRAWLPLVPPRAQVLIVHGLAEHIGRYEHVARKLTSEGYAVYGYDQRGHGRSDGRRAYIDAYDVLPDDLNLVYQSITRSFPDRPCFVLAHSMGTTVTLRFLIKHAPDLAGVVMSGTTIKIGPDIPQVLVSLSGIIGRLMPRLPILKLDATALSRDQSIVDGYLNDPFVYTGAIPARTGATINRAFANIRQRLNEITVPILLLHGAEDRLIDPEGSRLAYELIGSTDKTLDILDGLYHEILNEPEGPEILQEIEHWLEAHLETTHSI